MSRSQIGPSLCRAAGSHFGMKKHGTKAAQVEQWCKYRYLDLAGAPDSSLGMAESKSRWFALFVNAHSEKSLKFDLNPLKSLDDISECRDALRASRHEASQTMEWSPLGLAVVAFAWWPRSSRFWPFNHAPSASLFVLKFRPREGHCSRSHRRKHFIGHRGQRMQLSIITAAFGRAVWTLVLSLIITV
jgi:hypothetical protein